MKYGSNLAIALNIIMKQVQDGVALGVNTNNSTKLTYGYNNVFATYNRKNSLLTKTDTQPTSKSKLSSHTKYQPGVSV